MGAAGACVSAPLLGIAAVVIILVSNRNWNTCFEGQMTDKMRIIIYGRARWASGWRPAGAFGHAGRHGRPSQNVAAIRQNGLKLITAGGTHIVPIGCGHSPDQIEFSRQMWSFFVSKGQDTDSAMRDLFALVKDVPVFASRTECVMRKSSANIIRGFMA